MAKRKLDVAALIEAGKDAHLTDNFVNVSQNSLVDGKEFVKIKISDIQDNPLQPRKCVNEEELQELAKSIELHGLIHPITLLKVSDKKLFLMAGQRRLLAYKYLGRKEIPAIIQEDDRFKDLAKLDLLNDKNISKILFEISVSENESRESLKPIELAISIDEVLKKKIYSSVNEVSKVLGKSKAYITKIYSTLKLAEPILNDLLNTRGVGHIEALYELQKIKDQKLQVKLYNKLKEGVINIEDIKIHSVMRKKEVNGWDFKQNKNFFQIKINTKQLTEEKRFKMEQEIENVLSKYIQR